MSITHRLQLIWKIAKWLFIATRNLKGEHLASIHLAPLHGGPSSYLVVAAYHDHVKETKRCTYS